MLKIHSPCWLMDGYASQTEGELQLTVENQNITISGYSFY
jgi:hypothetical protein